MGSGGARNRSGPQPDPRSRTSERRGFKLTALPAEGFTGDAPEWPLTSVSERELALWQWAWRTPQACAWSMPSESWRLMSVAMWVRTFALCESATATAADKNSLHRFADQIGLTPAGLTENGWKVAVDELAQRRDEPSVGADEQAEAPKRERRMRAVSGGGA